MDFIFVKSAKAGKEDFGSVYARVRTGKANMKAVTGFTIRQLEWEKYRSLQYTSSALMSSIVENIKSLDPLLYSKLTHQKNIRIK